ncbi:MAG: hypothetical protein JSU86_04505 [Phycisphaerales bacterium]|nr:MAG: hypothetical protein JSU86_04505 [Phycisphaerales bacterium]
MLGGRISVSRHPARLNDTITFTASGVVDSGGEKRVDCVVNEEVPPVTPTYTWVITKPDGATVNGSGATAPVVADQPGTYSCTFTATANRDCPPPDYTIGPATGAPFVVEITTPNGDPTTTAGANATNERTYSSGADPTVTVPCAAANVPEASRLRWTIDDVGTIRATWSPSVPGDPYTGTGLSPTATFTGMPPNYDDFGAKTITLTVDGLANCQDTQAVEIFYAGMATNHPGGSPTFPNWFHYYEQNEGGIDYTYGCPNGRSGSQPGVPGSVQICDEAYAGDEYIITNVVGAQLKAGGWSGTNRYYANFLGVLAHERHHANNEVTTGPPDDRDNDFLSNTFETGISQTNPDERCSAAQNVPGFPCPPFDDGEVYGGGPVEQGGIAGANTSQDWADPGTNHG